MKKTFKYNSTRNGCGDALLELGKINQDVVVLTADLTESTRVNKFAKDFPDRFFNCGVAEQNMMSIAAGLAVENKIPFISSYAVFSPGRNWDQLRVNVCYNNANVKIAGHHTGLTVGADGATHQALEDIAIVKVLPNICVLSPLDYHEAYQATIAAANFNGPVYLRFTREESPIVTSQTKAFQIGQAHILKSGRDITLIGTGPILVNGLIAAYEVEKQGISVEVINLSTIKPLDQAAILKSIRKTKKVITLEEHQIAGGLGGSICELLSEQHPVHVTRLGIDDTFGESGSPQELIKKYHLDSRSIYQQIIKTINYQIC
ncbi:MAG TPA: transketolase C-terminal domain-containing protein [bacterium]|nr:transketolase C-terminal domain-containing protein [bacterium]